MIERLKKSILPFIYSADRSHIEMVVYINKHQDEDSADRHSFSICEANNHAPELLEAKPWRRRRRGCLTCSLVALIEVPTRSYTS